MDAYSQNTCSHTTASSKRSYLGGDVLVEVPFWRINCCEVQVSQTLSNLQEGCYSACYKYLPKACVLGQSLWRFSEESLEEGWGEWEKQGSWDVPLRGCWDFSDSFSSLSVFLPFPSPFSPPSPSAPYLCSHDRPGQLWNLEIWSKISLSYFRLSARYFVTVLESRLTHREMTWRYHPTIRLKCESTMEGLQETGDVCSSLEAHLCGPLSSPLHGETQVRVLFKYEPLQWVLKSHM